jgi:hypothetical protein
MDTTTRVKNCNGDSSYIYSCPYPMRKARLRNEKGYEGFNPAKGLWEKVDVVAMIRVPVVAP